MANDPNESRWAKYRRPAPRSTASHIIPTPAPPLAPGEKETRRPTRPYLEREVLPANRANPPARRRPIHVDTPEPPYQPPKQLPVEPLLDRVRQRMGTRREEPVAVPESRPAPRAERPGRRYLPSDSLPPINDGGPDYEDLETDEEYDAWFRDQVASGRWEGMDADPDPAPAPPQQPRPEGVRQTATGLPLQPPKRQRYLRSLGAEAVGGVADLASSTLKGVAITGAAQRRMEEEEPMSYLEQALSGERESRDGEIGESRLFGGSAGPRTRYLDSIGRDPATLPDADETLPYRIAEGIDEAAASLQRDPEVASSVPGKIVRGLGQFGGMALESLVSPTLAASSAVGMGATEAYERAKEAGASEEEALALSLPGAAIGATEMVPIQAALGRLAEPAKKSVAEVIRRAFVGFVEEGGQEAGSQFLQNLAHRLINAEQALGEGVVEGGGIGGAVGTIANLLLAAVPGRQVSAADDRPTAEPERPGILELADEYLPEGIERALEEPESPEIITAPGESQPRDIPTDAAAAVAERVRELTGRDMPTEQAPDDMAMVPEEDGIQPEAVAPAVDAPAEPASIETSRQEPAAGVRYSPEGRRVMISPSTREPGRVQATVFRRPGDDEPFGHSTFDSAAEAQEWAQSEGFTLADQPAAPRPEDQAEFDTLADELSTLEDARRNGDDWDANPEWEEQRQSIIRQMAAIVGTDQRQNEESAPALDSPAEIAPEPVSDQISDPAEPDVVTVDTPWATGLSAREEFADLNDHVDAIEEAERRHPTDTKAQRGFVRGVIEFRAGRPRLNGPRAAAGYDWASAQASLLEQPKKEQRPSDKALPESAYQSFAQEWSRTGDNNDGLVDPETFAESRRRYPSTGAEGTQARQAFARAAAYARSGGTPAEGDFQSSAEQAGYEWERRRKNPAPAPSTDSAPVTTSPVDRRAELEEELRQTNEALALPNITPGSKATQQRRKERIERELGGAAAAPESAASTESTPVSTSSERTVRDVGRDDFRKGKNRVAPGALDAAQKKEWYAGWDEANLAEPLPPLAGESEATPPAPASNFGAENKVFTQDAAEKAKERLRNKLKGTQLNAGLDPELMVDAVTLGGYYVEGGMREFGAWARQMLDDLGEGFRPYLRWTFEAIRTYPGFEAEGMTPSDQIETIDVPARKEQSEGEADPIRAAASELSQAAKALTDAASRIGTPKEVDDGTRSVGEAPRGEPAGEPARSVPTDAAGRDAEGVPGDRRPSGDGEVRRSGERDAREPGRVAEDVREEGGGARRGLQDREGDGPAGARARPDEGVRGLDGDRVQGLNYRITETDEIGRGGKKAKARQNVQAIRLLKQLESEGRQATVEEQRVLVRYVGWGGLKEVFHTNKASKAAQGFADVRAELEELLTEDEFRSVRASIKNAHYTSPEVIGAMWNAVEHLGFDRGRILEPSMGAGHFIGLSPDRHRSSTWMGVELDSITGRIARHLYPQARIEVKGFEEVALPNDSIDLAISNVPFGDYKVTDREFGRDRAYLKNRIHDYFFAKTLDKVRPGGLVAFITSDGTLDKGDKRVRQYLSDHADFLGAIRLPQDAFKATAGADVTTDIIFLRKRAEGAPPAQSQPFVNLASMQTADGRPAEVNEYFASHPEMILGRLQWDDNRYGAGEELHVLSDGRDMPEALASAVERLPTKAYVRAEPKEIAEPPAFAPISAADESVSEGSFVERDGVILQKLNGVLVDPGLGKGKTADHVRRMVKIRDALRETLRLQKEDAPEQQIKAAQKKLNREYDGFVKKYGPINKEWAYVAKRVDRQTGETIETPYTRQRNLEPFALDPDVNLLAALEDYDRETDTARKMPVFHSRVVSAPRQVDKVATPADGLPVVLAEKGRVDIERIAELAGTSIDEARDALVREGLIFENPETFDWETSERYLTGDVRKKLAIARTMAASDPRFERNVTALEQAQPDDIPPSEIRVQLGVPWVETGDYEAFLSDLLGGDGTLRWNEAKQGWKVEVSPHFRNTPGARSEWGTEDMDAFRLVEKALNQERPIVYVPDPSDPAGKKRMKHPEKTINAMVKQDELKERFAEWVWQDQARAERLHRYYNDHFNNLRIAQYDGSHLTFPGATKTIDGKNPFGLRPHQKAAVWRTLQNRATLLAHVVGAGKTFTMVGSAMEMRRLGIAKKPMFSVPNHMLRQFSNEFLQMYPEARILVADDKAFDAKRRKQFTAKIATGDWDAVIMTHSSFELIPVSIERRTKFIRDQITQLESSIREAKAEKGTDARNYVRELETAIERLEVRLDALMADAKKDDLLSFEELGVDALFVDEAHMFKNLLTSSKIQGMSIEGAQRSLDLFLKTGYLHEIQGRLTFATGTPISNSMGETYTLMRYLQPETLQERGMTTFDQWAAQFGRTVVDAEKDVSGTRYKMKERFARFVNVPELIQTLHQVWDVQTADDLQRMGYIKRPPLIGGKPEAVTIEKAAELEDFLQRLGKRADDVAAKRVDPEVDNMLKIATDGRHAALDLRLVDPWAEDLPQNKVNLAVDQIHAIWKEHAAHKGAQLVFLDISTPSAASRQSATGGRDYFSIYFEIRDKLIRAGVPENEIAFMQDAAGNDKKKARLLQSVRDGDVRILLGSTETMGAGTNVQDRLVALHHLDVPWVPANLEQREGRILRQGNRLVADGLIEGVRIFRYAQVGSFDIYMWQTVERKARFISQVMKGDLSVREMEDLDAVVQDAATMKAILADDPLAIEKIQVDQRVSELKAVKRGHDDRLYNVRSELNGMGDRIRLSEIELERKRADAERVEDTTGDAFKVELGKTVITERPAAGERLKRALGDEWLASKMEGATNRDVRLGKFAGFDLYLRFTRDARGEPTADLILQGETEHTARVGLSASEHSLVSNLEAMARSIPKSVERQAEKVAELKERKSELERLKDQPFKQAEELNNALARQKALEEQMHAQANADQPGTTPDEDVRDNPEAGFLDLAAIFARFTAHGVDEETEIVSTLPEVERRWQEAKGIESSRRREVREALANVYRQFRRHFPLLDARKNATMGMTVDILRQYEASPEWAKAVARDKIAETVDGLSAAELDVFTRLLVLPDILRDVEEGRYGDPASPRELPFGYRTAAQVEADLAHFEKLAGPKVQAALAKRRRFTRAITERLVEHDLLHPDVLKDDRYYHRQVMEYVNAQDRTYAGTGSKDVRLKKKGFQKGRTGGGDFNTDYLQSEFEWVAQGLSLIARKETLDRVGHLNNVAPMLRSTAKTLNQSTAVEKYRNDALRAMGIDPDRATPDEVEMIEDPLKPYRMRIGRAQAELRKMAEDGTFDHETVGGYSDVIEALEKGGDHRRWWEFLAHLAAEDERAGSLQARSIFKAIRDRNDWIEQTAGDQFVTWRDLIPDGYTVWQPEKGNHFFMGATVAEQVLDRVLAGEKDLQDSDVRQVLMVGGRKAEWVIPEELAATLDEFQPDYRDDALEGVWTGLQSSWKQWILINPVRVLKYNLNNMSGDLDIALAYDPKMLAFFNEAAKDLWAYQVRGKGSPELREEMQDATRRGVLQSGLSIVEIPDINRAGVFRALTETDPRKRATLVEKFWENETWGGVRGFTNWRENILRLAAYRYFQQRLLPEYDEKGTLVKEGEKNVYAASNRKEVDAIKDPHDRAAKLARELIGDYGNVSRAGQWIRRHLIPFYSWIEINAPRYVRLLKNVPHEGGSRASVAGAAAGAVAKKTAIELGTGYISLAVKVNLIYALVNLWNHAMFPDEEEELGRSGRENHIILGRDDETGEIRTLRIEGAFADALEWFKFNDWPSDVKDVLEGRADLLDKAAEAAKGPVDRIIQSWEPFSKTLFETTMGRQSYPTIFEEGKSFELESRPIRDRWDHVLGLVSLDWLYNRVIAKKPRRPGSNGPLGAIQAITLYRTDPGEAAYWHVRDLAVKYLEEQGREFPSVQPTKRQNALYYYRQAVKWGDEERAEYWLEKYYDMGGRPRDVRGSITRAHPIGSIPQRDRKAFLEQLSERDRAILERAEKWYGANVRTAAPARSTSSATRPRRPSPPRPPRPPSASR